MEIKYLKAIVEEGVNSGDLEKIGTIGTHHDLEHEILQNKKRNTKDYEYLILLPVFAKEGYKLNLILDVYGKLSPKDSSQKK